nr:MAG: hypothetical protein DIU78_12880 [Pseudomonadota bacterium]
MPVSRGICDVGATPGVHVGIGIFSPGAGGMLGGSEPVPGSAGFCGFPGDDGGVLGFDGFPVDGGVLGDWLPPPGEPVGGL